MAVRTYSSRRMSILIDSVPITGLAPDTFINVAPTADSFTKSVGSSGEVSRAEVADRTGTVTLTLQQTSPSNEYLTQLHDADRVSLANAKSFMLKDENGTTVISAESCWISRLPDSEYSQEVGTREWTLELSDMSAQIGSNNLS